MTRPAVILLRESDLPLAMRVRELLDGTLHGPERLAARVDAGYRALAAHLRSLYLQGVPIVAICASGILMRALAPVLGGKEGEPPVLALDRAGRFVVPLLGGHRGGNRMARMLARALGAEAVVTTASEGAFGLALDEPPEGWRLRGGDHLAPFLARLLAGDGVRLEDETGAASWLAAGDLPWNAAARLEIRVTLRRVQPTAERLVYHPPMLALGAGTVRGAEPGKLIALAEKALERHGLAREAVACVVSIDLKCGEPAVHALAAHLGVPARFFTADELRGFEARLLRPSAAVRREIGVAGVAEAAALAAAGPKAQLVVPKQIGDGVTCAIARAASALDAKRVGRARGRLWVVGIGPGGGRELTRQALEVLEEAEVLVGYRLYLELLGPLGRGRERYAFALGEEMARCRAALDLAAAGRSVALVSSGDGGIYAMASPLLELLAREGEAKPEWRRVAIEMVPGISAMQAAAARSGAILGHDFCAISLSDLLTPRAQLLRRIEAAAAADFVIAFYNPASTGRREPLRCALEILARYRRPQTPVVVARDLGREGEEVHLATLAELEEMPIDMRTIVIVGSRASRTVRLADGSRRIYTPRGYAGR